MKRLFVLAALAAPLSAAAQTAGNYTPVTLSNLAKQVATQIPATALSGLDVSNARVGSATVSASMTGLQSAISAEAQRALGAEEKKADALSGTLTNPIINGGIKGRPTFTPSNTSAPTYLPGVDPQLGQILSAAPQTDKSVWVSSVSQIGQYSAANTGNIRATGRVTFSTSNASLATNASDLSPIQAAVDAFAGTSGSFGILHDSVLTPGLPMYRIPVSSPTQSITVSPGTSISPNHVEIDLNGAIVGKDNGSGLIIGSGGSGTVNYTTGAISFTFASAAAADAEVWAGIWLPGGFGSITVPSTWWQVWDQSGSNDTSPAQLKQLGYAPTLGLLNMNGASSTTSAYSSMAASDMAVSTANISAAIPSIKRVIPFISPNGTTFGTFATDSYWASARAAALQQGGFAIDMPVGFFLWNSDTYRAFVVQMIKWAHQNGLMVVSELSPGNPVTGQENDYLTEAQQVVSFLMDNHAIPNVWYVDQYVFNVYPGTDDTNSASYSTNSTLAVARWITDNVPTEPYPAGLKGTQSAGSLVAAPAVLNGNITSRQTIGNLYGSLGSMALQGASNVNITGGKIVGSAITGDLNVSSVALPVGGAVVVTTASGHTATISGDGNGNVIVNTGGGTLQINGNFSQYGGNSTVQTLIYDPSVAVPTATSACTPGQVAHGKDTDGNFHEYFCYATNQWAMSPAYSTSGF